MASPLTLVHTPAVAPHTYPRRTITPTFLLEVAATRDLQALLETVVKFSVSALQADSGAITLFDPARQTPVMEVLGARDGLVNTFNLRAGAPGAPRQATILLDPAQAGATLGPSHGLSAQSVLAVPIISRGEPLGSLEVRNPAAAKPFSAPDREFLESIAALCGAAAERIRLEAALAGEHEHMLSAERAIRATLANLLHSGPVQLVSALIMNIRFLNEILQRTPDRALGELTQIDAIAQKALLQARNMMFDLHPATLEAQGLGPTLQAFSERLKILEPFMVEVDTGSLNARWPAVVESAVFFILEEAVTNAKLHATPHQIWIEARQGERRATFRVRDDGVGFDVPQALDQAAVKPMSGLSRMRERAAMLPQVELRFDSSPGRGTTVTLSIPLAAR